ncbi:MAG: hypothetical protein H6999_06525 [Hahellaceae bacterium]|nr:hypothetical protein [Hahellaceae bacterium]
MDFDHSVDVLIKPLCSAAEAKSGIPYAQNSTKQDDRAMFEKALELAKQGDALAQGYVAGEYYDGNNVEQNYQEAYKWFYEISRTRRSPFAIHAWIYV